MGNADSLLKLNKSGEIEELGAGVQLLDGAGSGRAAGVNAKHQLQTETTLIAGEITIGNVKLEGVTGNVAKVNSLGELQVNTETVVLTHTVNKIENVEYAVPSGYQYVTVWVFGTYTGLTVKTMAKRGGVGILLPLVSIASVGASAPTSTIANATAANVAFAGILPAGTETLFVEVTAIATGEAKIEVAFGNEPVTGPALQTGTAEGTTSVGSATTGKPILGAITDTTGKCRTQRGDEAGVQAVYPFNPEKPWSEEITVGAGASAKTEKTLAGVAGYIYVITSVVLTVENSITLSTKVAKVQGLIQEETSLRTLAKPQLSANLLTEGSTDESIMCANPVAVASTAARGLIFKLEKGLVEGTSGAIFATGYMIKGA